MIHSWKVYLQPYRVWFLVIRRWSKRCCLARCSGAAKGKIICSDLAATVMYSFLRRVMSRSMYDISPCFFRLTPLQISHCVCFCLLSRTHDIPMMLQCNTFRWWPISSTFSAQKSHRYSFHVNALRCWFTLHWVCFFKYERGSLKHRGDSHTNFTRNLLDKAAIAHVKLVDFVLILWKEMTSF